MVSNPPELRSPIILQHQTSLFEDVVYVHSKLSVVVWGLIYMTYPPVGVVQQLGHGLIYASGIFAVVGSIMGMFGLLMSRSKKIKLKHQGHIIEAAGLYVAICGPMTFCFTVGYLSLKFHATQGYSFTIFAYALCAFMLSRIVTVRRYLKEQW